MPDQIAGATDIERALIRRASRRFVLTSQEDPAQQPEHAQAARLTAGFLARSCGLVADLATNQILMHGDRPETVRRSFALADDWLSIFVTSADTSQRLVAKPTVSPASASRR